MFKIKGLNGEFVFNTDMDSPGEDSTFATYDEALKTLKNMEESLPKGQFKIVAVNCERCDGEDDIAIIHVNDEPKAFCVNCRVEVFAKKKPVGRPAIGVTKKVSITLEENEWKLLDEKAQGNRSAFIREILSKELN